MKTLVLYLWLLVFPLISACTSLVVDNSVPHPELESASAIGYVEMWVPTSFGMWLKNLEEGPVTCDNIEIDAPGIAQGKHLCVVKQLAWPALAGHVGLSKLKYRPIADNFSACRIAMPAGKHTVYARPGLNCYPENVVNKFKAGGYAVPGMLVKKYKTPVFVIDLEIEPGRLHNFLLHVSLDGDNVRFFADEANTTLPIPNNPNTADPDPASYQDLLKMLEADIWGFRWYAARRLGFLDNQGAIPALRTKLEDERHKDVRNELQKALERLN